MRPTRTLDREDPECRFFAEKKHPNRKNKKEFSLTINPEKMEGIIKAVKEKTFPSKDLSRTFFITPSNVDIAWLKLIFDVDRPMENLESPKSRILKIRYINNKGKNRPKEIYFDGHLKGKGWVYWFDVQNIEEAEYLLPFIERYFLSEEIRIFNPEYRESNRNMWKPLDGFNRNYVI